MNSTRYEGHDRVAVIRLDNPPPALNAPQALPSTAIVRSAPLTRSMPTARCSSAFKRSGERPASALVPPLDRRIAVVAQFAADLRRLGPANFLYADGDTLFAHGHRRIQPSGQILPPGLFLLARQCTDADEAVCADGVAIASDLQEVVLIASVPLTDEQWRPFSEGELVAVSAGRLVGPHLS